MANRGPFATEMDLAAVVISWLQNQEWDIYQEVGCRGGRADIVAVRDRIAWIIECKLQAGLGVLEQAIGHVGTAHYVSVATPSKQSLLLEQVAEWKGIGWLNVSIEVSERVAPRLHRRLQFDVRSRLKPEHKSYAKAGSSSGGHWTPFKGTCQQVAQYVLGRPGCTVKELVDSIKTHYRSSATARTSLPKWIELGKVPGVRLERDGKQLRLYPDLGDKS